MQEYVDTVVRVGDLVTDPRKPLVTDTRFTRCELVGPAILYLQNCHLGFTLETGENIEEALYEVSPSRERVIGAVVFDRCELSDCRMTAIGIVGRPHFLGQYRKALGLT
jgi:hypothetical protein